MQTTTCGNRVTSKRTVMFTSKEVVVFTGDEYDRVHIIIRGYSYQILTWYVASTNSECWEILLITTNSRDDNV